MMEQEAAAVGEQADPQFGWDDVARTMMARRAYRRCASTPYHFFLRVPARPHIYAIKYPMEGDIASWIQSIS